MVIQRDYFLSTILITLITVYTSTTNNTFTISISLTAVQKCKKAITSFSRRDQAVFR